MGNSAKKPDDYEIVSSYNHRQWSVKDQLMHCQVWKNNLLNYDVEAYEMQANLKPQELDKYTFRNQNNKDIVGVHHVIPEENEFLCSKGDKMHVLTERIPVTLDRVNNLNENEALCVLSSAYSGYNTIGSHYGPVMPYENCIGFTPSGKPKVWINSNFASNRPFKDQKISDSDELQKRNRSYVREIFNMVDQRTIGGLPRLRQIFNKKQPTYFEALNILQHYTQTTNIRVPSTIEMRHLNPNEQYQSHAKQVDLHQLASGSYNNLQSYQISHPNNLQYHQQQTPPIKNNVIFQRQIQNQVATPIPIINPGNRIPQSQAVFINNPHNSNSAQKTVISNISHNHYLSPPANARFNTHAVRHFASPPPSQVSFPTRSLVINNQLKPQSRNRQQIISGAQKQSQTVFVESEAQQTVVKRQIGSNNFKTGEIQQTKQVQKQLNLNQKQRQQKELQANFGLHKADQKVEKSQNRIEQDIQSSRVERVENNDTLQRHIQDSKSHQNLVRRVPQAQTIIHQISAPRYQHIQHQPPIIQYANQIQQRIVSPQPYPRISPVQYGVPQANLLQQQYPSNQMTAIDQFGRIINVNQAPHPHHIYSQPIQVNYSNQGIQPPSPQMVTKSQSIQQARRSAGQTPVNQKQIQHEQISYEQRLRENELPQQSQVTEKRTQRGLQKKKSEIDQNEVDYSYSDLRSRGKGDIFVPLKKESQKPQVTNQQDQDDQYQQYIRLQQQRQARIDEQKLRQEQQRHKQQVNRRQPSYQRGERRKDYQPQKRQQIKRDYQQQQNRVVRTHSSNQRRQVQNKRVPIDDNFEEQIRRSNKQMREIRQRRMNNAYSNAIEEAVDNQRKQLRHLASYQIQRHEPSETNNQPLEYREQSVRQYRSIDQNTNSRYEQEQNLNKSYDRVKSPTESRKRIDREQSPRSHTSGKSRSSQLQMARLDREREKLEKERKEIQARRNKRDQYWNNQSRGQQRQPTRQNRVRDTQYEEDIVNKTSRASKRQERQEQYEVYERPDRQQRKSRRRDDSVQEVPYHEPALRNITSVTTAYEVINNPDQRHTNQYSSGTGGDSSNPRNERKRYTRDPQPAIPESYQVDDIEEYIRKKYNIKSQVSNVQQSANTRGTRNYDYTSGYDSKYGTSKYDTSKYDTSKYDTSKYDTSKYETLNNEKQDNKYLQQSDRSGKGDQQLGRHNLLTFMPQDREKNLLVIQNQIKNQRKQQQGFNVADMEMNLKKFQESRHRAPKESSSYKVTRIETKIQDKGDGERITRKKYERTYKDQDDPYAKYQSNYEENIEPSRRRKGSKNTNDLEKYKGSSAIDQKYEKYISGKDKLKESQASNRVDSQADVERRGSKTRSRFEKYTKQSRTFEDKYPENQYDIIGRNKELTNSNTFVKKEGGIDKLSYDQLRNMLWN